MWINPEIFNPLRLLSILITLTCSTDRRYIETTIKDLPSPMTPVPRVEVNDKSGFNLGGNKVTLKNVHEVIFY